MPAPIPTRRTGMNPFSLFRAIFPSMRKVDLGFRLYHDERLSGDSTISCAHCHALNAGGVDGRKTSIGVGGAVGPINAPTVFNSVFNIEQFWDGRAATLQEQAGGPPLNPIEMASKSRDEIISKLDKDPVLKRFPCGLSARIYRGKYY